MQKPTKEEIIKAYDELRDAEVEHFELQQEEEKIKLAVKKSHSRVLMARDAVRGLTGY